MHHFSCLQGDIGHRVGHRHDFLHRKLRQGRQRVRIELQRTRAGVGLFDDDVRIAEPTS